MNIPSQACVELPLLLELERADGPVTKRRVYDLAAQHFPNLTVAEKKEITFVKGRPGDTQWGVVVRRALRKLVHQGEVESPQRGQRKITEQGRQRLRRELIARGIPDADVDSFINSRQTIPKKVGAWPPVIPPPEEPSDIETKLLKRVHALTPDQFKRLVARLIDGEALVKLLLDRRLGIKDVVVQAEIDEDFFRGLGE